MMTRKPSTVLENFLAFCASLRDRRQRRHRRQRHIGDNDGDGRHGCWRLHNLGVKKELVLVVLGLMLSMVAVLLLPLLSEVVAAEDMAAPLSLAKSLSSMTGGSVFLLRCCCCCG